MKRNLTTSTRRTAALLGLGFLLLGAAQLRAQTGKSLIVQPKSGAFAGKTFYSNSHAVIVGIGNYPGLPRDKQLKYAAADAIALRAVLIRS